MPRTIVRKDTRCWWWRHPVALLLITVPFALISQPSNQTTVTGSLVHTLALETNDLLGTCLSRNGSRWECLRNETLTMVEQLARSERIMLLRGINLVRTDAPNGLPPAASFNGRTVRNDLEDVDGDGKLHRTGAWSATVLDALRRILRTHLLEINLGNNADDGNRPQSPADEMQLLTVRFTGKPFTIEQQQQQQQPVEGRNRRRQQMIPMMIFGVTVFGMFIVPIAFQFLTALSGKAFLMAKLALLLASINGLKRVASTGVHYGLYHAVDHYPSPHHHPGGGGGPHPHFGPGGPLLYDRAEVYGEGPRHAGATTP
ncbi:uncharacterized protein LOC125948940 [Anopheles darlingi]|uniref:uncharacterized protein LOC125948940 n=1 Tax=Anopheles darlingi TaxID=43151 RepID=UPI002100009A|nr:uncharacterized protein LOC125948940 [Anopheles darlingi]